MISGIQEGSTFSWSRYLFSSYLKNVDLLLKYYMEY